MRLLESVDARAVYECFGCGNRQDDPESRFCPTCGSRMRNIGRPRDL